MTLFVRTACLNSFSITARQNFCFSYNIEHTWHACRERTAKFCNLLNFARQASGGFPRSLSRRNSKDAFEIRFENKENKLGKAKSTDVRHTASKAIEKFLSDPFSYSSLHVIPNFFSIAFSTWSLVRSQEKGEVDFPLGQSRLNDKYLLMYCCCFQIIYCCCDRVAPIRSNTLYCKRDFRLPDSVN